MNYKPMITDLIVCEEKVGEHIKKLIDNKQTGYAQIMFEIMHSMNRIIQEFIVEDRNKGENK